MGSQVNAQTPERSPDIGICFTHTLYRAVIKRWGTGISPGYIHGKVEEKCSQTSRYGHLFVTDSSIGPRNAKNQTFPTSIIGTPL